MWFIGVEVEQETSAPPPKKNPGSAPATTSNFIPLEFNRDSVGKAREAYLIETRDKTLEPFRYQ